MIDLRWLSSDDTPLLRNIVHFCTVQSGVGNRALVFGSRNHSDAHKHICSSRAYSCTLTHCMGATSTAGPAYTFALDGHNTHYIAFKKNSSTSLAGAYTYIIRNVTTKQCNTQSKKCICMQFHLKVPQIQILATPHCWIYRWNWTVVMVSHSLWGTVKELRMQYGNKVEQ